MSDNLTIPGVFISIHEHGCLITGDSNSGKSELALSLVDRGHPLVSDDVTEFMLKDDEIIGQAPVALQNLIELRDIGIVNIAKAYGDWAIKYQEKLSIIIELDGHPQNNFEHRLKPKPTLKNILDQDIPCYTLSPYTQRPLALLAELLVINHIQSKNEALEL